MQKPCDENSVDEYVLDKVAGKDSRPVTNLKRTFHQGGFPVDTTEYLAVSTEGPTYTT